MGHEHYCENMPAAFHVEPITEEDGCVIWLLSSTEVVHEVKIQFCPFCGINLEEQ